MELCALKVYLPLIPQRISLNEFYFLCKLLSEHEIPTILTISFFNIALRSMERSRLPYDLFPHFARKQ